MSERILAQLQRLVVRLLAAAAKGAVKLPGVLPPLATLFGKPMRTIGRFFLWVFVLPGYKIYLAVKKTTKKFYAPHKSRHRFLHPFARRYLVHFMVILLAGFTLASNLNASEVRHDDQAPSSIAAQLDPTVELGELAEEGPIQAGSQVSHYLTIGGLRAQPRSGEDQNPELLPTVGAGQSAVVRPILSPAQEQLLARDRIVSYTVQVGDTLSDIASRFGITINTLLWENNLTAYSLIRPGNKLTILPSSGIRHKVVKGDSLPKIAKEYAVDAQSIIDANLLASADDLRLGEFLLIPGGKKPYVPPAYSIPRTPYQAAPTQRVVSTGRMVWPNACRRISQYFRWRHSGVDIACPHSSSIVAADSGVVIKAQGGWNGGYGNMIVIDHGGGLQTLYGHLSSIQVSVGQGVGKGQVIGLEGSTGRSTGPHLHFEVRSGGVKRNPLGYIK